MEDVRNETVDDVDCSPANEPCDGNGASVDGFDWDAASGETNAGRGRGPGPPEPGVGSRSYRTTHDWNGAEPLGTTVVDAVSRATGQSMFEVERLSTVVDPDALESVFRPVGDDAAKDAHVTFPLAGQQVTVYASGDVFVESA